MERFPPTEAQADQQPDRLSGEEVCSLMRQYRVTIRQLAETMQITLKRVREVRGNGVEGEVYVRDWYEAITEICPRINREITEGLEDVCDGRVTETFFSVEEFKSSRK